MSWVMSYGDVLGPYRLCYPLARGGFAEVWLAEEWLSQAQVALKVFVHRAHAALLQEESNQLAALRGHGVVEVHRVDLDSDPPWLALRFFPGGDLRTLVRRGDCTRPSQ